MIFRLLENLLFEDKMVKFNNEIAPKYGWCCIYVGGPGSGKGTATNLSVRLQGHKFDPDDLKRPEVLKKTGIWDTLETPESERTLNNSDYVSELHDATEPLKNKVMSHELNQGKYSGKDRLPNIIFDIVGSTGKFNEIIPTAKEMGYKVAIVWTLTDVQKAILQNRARPRNVREEVLIEGHKKVIKAIESLFNSNLLNSIDDFWVIDNTNSVQIRKIEKDGKQVNNPEDEYKYIKDTNVYHIELNKDGFSKFTNIIQQIDKNKEYLSQF